MRQSAPTYQLKVTYLLPPTRIPTSILKLQNYIFVLVAPVQLSPKDVYRAESQGRRPLGDSNLEVHLWATLSANFCSRLSVIMTRNAADILLLLEKQLYKGQLHLWYRLISINPTILLSVATPANPSVVYVTIRSEISIIPIMNLICDITYKVQKINKWMLFWTAQCKSISVKI